MMTLLALLAWVAAMVSIVCSSVWLLSRTQKGDRIPRHPFLSRSVFVIDRWSAAISAPIVHVLGGLPVTAAGIGWSLAWSAFAGMAIWPFVRWQVKHRESYPRPPDYPANVIDRARDGA